MRNGAEWPANKLPPPADPNWVYEYMCACGKAKINANKDNSGVIRFSALPAASSPDPWCTHTHRNPPDYVPLPRTRCPLLVASLSSSWPMSWALTSQLMLVGWPTDSGRYSGAGPGQIIFHGPKSFGLAIKFACEQSSLLLLCKLRMKVNHKHGCSIGILIKSNQFGPLFDPQYFLSLLCWVF